MVVVAVGKLENAVGTLESGWPVGVTVIVVVGDDVAVPVDCDPCCSVDDDVVVSPGRVTVGNPVGFEASPVLLVCGGPDVRVETVAVSSEVPMVVEPGTF